MIRRFVLASAVVSLLCVAGDARATLYTDSFGGTASTGGVYDTWVNAYYIGADDCTLEGIDVWFMTNLVTERDRQVSFGVWEWDNYSYVWNLVWSHEQVMPATGWSNWQWAGPGDGDVSVPLSANHMYAVGVWSDREIYLGHGTSSSTMGNTAWGGGAGYMYWDNHTTFPGALYEYISGIQNGGYRQQITVNLAYDDDGDGHDSDTEQTADPPRRHRELRQRRGRQLQRPHRRVRGLRR